MKHSAQAKYMMLKADREDYLDAGRQAARLTLPYILTDDGHVQGGPLPTPWQSVGSKGVNVLASKLMLSLFPVNTSFFKLQINDAEIDNLGMDEQARSEIDLSLSRIERIVTQDIAESSDRVHLEMSMKHLIVTGNVLLYQGKKNLKLYPLDRFVVSRDGDGNVMEIVTEEQIDRSLLPEEFQKVGGLEGSDDSNAVGEDGPKMGVTASSGQKGKSNDALVYTYVCRKDGQVKWYQECDGKVIPGSNSSSPYTHNPWIPLRFNIVDGEAYGRGRVEEFMGDLKSLESLSQAIVEGSAASAKVVFMVSPSATTKPQNLALAANGAIIQGRPDDVAVVQANKAADFRTVLEMITRLEQRISDAFLMLQVRQSERTTATEVQATVQELNEQIGGIYSNLTTELLQPYLSRKLYLLQKQHKLPKLPKDLVTPTVVAGLWGVGRGQDKQQLMEFITTLAQTMGPEIAMKYINPSEFIKRLAAAQGIDTLQLINSPDTMKQQGDQAKQDAMMASLTNQAGQLAKTPMAEQMMQGIQQQAQGAQDVGTADAETSAAEAEAGA